MAEDEDHKALLRAKAHADSHLKNQAMAFIYNYCMADVEAARKLWHDAFEIAAEGDPR
jgi:hypothetical protein